MARLLRVLVKLAILGGVIAVVTKVLQNRSHPAPVVDRNAYNSWEPLKEPEPVAPAGEAAEPPAASNGAATAAKVEATTKEAPTNKAPTNKAPTKKAPAKKTATKKKAGAKEATKKAAKEAGPPPSADEDAPPAEPTSD